MHAPIRITTLEVKMTWEQTIGEVRIDKKKKEEKKKAFVHSSRESHTAACCARSGSVYISYRFLFKEVRSFR